MLLANLLTYITQFIGNKTVVDGVATYNGLIGWIVSFFTWVFSNPILFVFTFLTLSGMVIRIVKKWLPGRV